MKKRFTFFILYLALAFFFFSGTTKAQSYSFGRTLFFGARGEDVRTLQKFLNRNGFNLTINGPGSPGNETTFFGTLTSHAVESFQCTYKIICSGTAASTGYGIVGPKTRKVVGDIMRGETGIRPIEPSPPPFTPPSPTARFIRPLFYGENNGDTYDLQRFLNKNGFTVTSKGPGSPGNETNFYGHHTTAAVQRFQCVHEIVCSGDHISTGYGVVGPRTRAKLNELYDENIFPPSSPISQPSPVDLPIPSTPLN